MADGKANSRIVSPFLQVKKYSHERNNSILKLRHDGINFHLKRDVITFAPAYLSKIIKVALEATRMTIHTTLHKAGQTKFTVHHHNIFYFTCGRAVII